MAALRSVFLLLVLVLCAGVGELAAQSEPGCAPALARCLAPFARVSATLPGDEAAPAHMAAPGLPRQYRWAAIGCGAGALLSLLANQLRDEPVYGAAFWGCLLGGAAGAGASQAN